MSKKTIEIKTLKLAHTKDGTINVAHIEKPYGEYSSPVASIRISLGGGEQEWKVHIPYENLDDVIKALNDAHRVSEGLSHEELHAELAADTGGGQ